MLRISRFSLLVLALTAFGFSGCDDKSVAPEPPLDILERLEALPGITVTEMDVPTGELHSRAFEITLTQPLDHDNPSGGTFEHHMFLLHANVNAPMVLVLTGYAATRNVAGEAAQLLSANQLYVDHRFMGASRPEPVDWPNMTVAQAAADDHNIVETFKEIYRGQWVSYGASKGGVTALIHKRFYPDDVEATVARVAPIVFGVEDPRFDVFLTETVADEDCREKYRQFQIRCLEERDSMLVYLQEYADNSIYTYSITLDSAFEYSVLEYPFAFFQNGSGDCADIPDGDATYQEMLDALMSESGIELFSDEFIAFYEPVYYQFYTEMGYYRLIDDHLTDYLQALTDPTYSRFAPQGVDLTFHPEVMQDIAQWLATEGDRIIYIYGAVDPWTAGEVEFGGDVDALKIIEPGANHRVTISTLTNPVPVYEKLEEWLEVGIEIPAVSRPVAEQELAGGRP